MKTLRLRKKTNLVIGLLVLGSCADPSDPAVDLIRVPRDYPTPQAAIDAARPGDTVLLDAGVYLETAIHDVDPVEYPAGVRAGIRLRPGVRVIGAGRPGSVVFRDTTGAGFGAVLARQPASTEVRNLAFEGFHTGVLVLGGGGVVRGCRVRDVLAGIHVFRAGSPRILDNHVEGARVDGILNQFADGVYAGNRVAGCTAGFGVEFSGSPEILGNISESNAMGIICNVGGSPLIRGNLIRNNRRAGILSGDGSIPVIRGNDIVGNAVGLEVGFYWEPLALPLDATGNYWGTVDSGEIQATGILDRSDDATRGAEVQFRPFRQTPVFPER